MPKKLLYKEFLKRSKYKHGDKYDYSLVIYKNQYNKIKIICPVHGEFLQIPKSHMNGHGCVKCMAKINGLRCKGIYHPKLNSEEVIKRAKNIFNYDYSESYLNKKYICNIKCPKHGYFMKLITNHLYQKQGCPKCGSNKISKEEFVIRSNVVHQNKYNYDNFIYKNFETKSLITCKIHGDFLQAPEKHLYGRGCPFCHSSKISKGELFIRNFLIYRGEEFMYNKPVDGLRIRMDFYLQKRKICIEYDGIQHFTEYRFTNEKENLKTTQERDLKKNEYCKKNGILLIRISYKFYHKLDRILNDILIGKYKETTFIY